MERKISALKIQKKNPNRINVYLDGQFSFGVSRIVGAWLRIGEILSEERILDLKHQDSQESALQKAMMLISYRPRSEQEIKSRLLKAGYESGCIERTIQKLSSSGLIGDGSFARDWVENRTVFKPRSRRMIAFELRQKGVAFEAIEGALDEAIDDDMLAYQAACKQKSKVEKLDKPEYQKKILAYLARLGFTYEVARTASNKLWQELVQMRSERPLSYDNEDVRK